MAAELVEIGFETFDFINDKYHDTVYDGVSRVRPWMRERKLKRTLKTQPVSKRTSDPAMREDNDRRGSGERRASHRQSRDRDDYYSDDEEERRRRRRERRRADSHGGYYDEPSRVEEWARENRAPVSTNPQITLSADQSHIYPPPPQPMAPPYPTTAGQLVAMPPDAPYPLERARSDEPYRNDPRALLPNADTRPLTRSRSANARPRRRSRSRSWSRERERERDRGHRGKHGHNMHLTAGLAGALAGGFLGKQVSKGDLAATVAGAVVGALGAGVAEREYERHQTRHQWEEDQWENKWGRR